MAPEASGSTDTPPPLQAGEVAPSVMDSGAACKHPSRQLMSHGSNNLRPDHGPQHSGAGHRPTTAGGLSPAPILTTETPTMNPLICPYAPGAGASPPELAGLDTLLESARIATARVRLGRQAKGLVMIGPHGAGKTVLLDRMRSDLEQDGIHTVGMTAAPGRSLPAMLVPGLHRALQGLTQRGHDPAPGKRALCALAGFVTGLKASYGDIDIHLDASPEPGLADNGDLEHDLRVLLQLAGSAAQAAGTALVLLVDQMHEMEDNQLGALIGALHHCGQQRVPVTLIATGLPSLPGRMGQVRSYAERQFDFPVLGALDDDAARNALVAPARRLGVEFTPEAIQKILVATQGYPYFLQMWGKHCWSVAQASPISSEDVETASAGAIADLDAYFFSVHLEELTAAENTYLNAMAQLGPGPHRPEEIAVALGRDATCLDATRARLIAKGIAWRVHDGDIDFAMPLLDAYLRRISQPGDGARQPGAR